MENETDNVNTTPAFRKPEFWLTLTTSVAGLLLAFGIITPDQAKDVGEYVPNIIGALMSLLASFKFINTQHAAKVEVFRAMCSAAMQRAELAAGNPGASAQGVAPADGGVAKLARAAGL